MQPTVLLDGRAFLEGPRWRGDRLWFSDIPAGEVLTVDMDGRCELVASVAGSPSVLGWLPDGTLLVARGSPAALMAVAPDGDVRVHVDLSDVAAFPLNDMVVDGAGRAWVGTCDMVGIPAPAVSQLLCVGPDRSVTVIDAAMRFPNGSVITPDGRTLIVAETMGADLVAFDIGPDGRAAGKRTWASVPGTFPDGICLDAEGAVWFADAGDRAVVRVREDGDVLDRISVGRGCYACTLGGPDGRTLFLLTGDPRSLDQARIDRPGRIETVTVDVPGGGSP